MHTTLTEVVLRTALIYIILFVALRVFGKREISQVTHFDLILLLLLSNAVQYGMLGDNMTVEAGIAAVLTLLCLNYGLNLVLARNVKLRHWLEGNTTVLLRHGKIEWPSMKRENVNIAVLMKAVREHGLTALHEVDLAMLELDGSISVIGSREAAIGKPAQSTRRRPLA